MIYFFFISAAYRQHFSLSSESFLNKVACHYMSLTTETIVKNKGETASVKTMSLLAKWEKKARSYGI